MKFCLALNSYKSGKKEKAAASGEERGRLFFLPNKLRSSYSVNEQVAKRIANICFDMKKENFHATNSTKRNTYK